MAYPALDYLRGKYFLVAKTIYRVIIDHPDSLHEGIADGGSDELETARL